MARNFSWIFLFILLPLLHSCDDELEFNVKTASPRLVVNSIFAQDSLIRIEISTTARLGDGSHIRSLTDARVFLTEGGIAITDLILDSTMTTQWYMLGTSKPQDKKLYFFRTEYTTARSGRPYRVEVMHKDYTTVAASSTIPRAARAHILPSRGNSNLSLDGEDFKEITFDIVDNGQENYYALELLVKEGKKAPRKKVIFYATEKIFAQNLSNSDDHSGQGVYYLPNNGVYFTNQKFLGKTRKFSIYADAKMLAQSEEVQLRILSLSNQFYQFATTWQKQRYNVGDPFAQPVTVYSNIQNGLGVFAGYTVTTLQLK